jgi:hypothetical protein
MKITYSFLIIISSIFLLQCSNETTAPLTNDTPPQQKNYDSTFVSIYNFFTSSSSSQIKIDIIVDDKLWYESILFQSGIVTKPLYLPKDKNTVSFRVVNNQTKEQLYVGQKSFEKNQKYVGFFIGNKDFQNLETTPDLIFTKNDFTTFSNGSARIKFVHASVGTGEVDLYSGGTKQNSKVLSKIRFGEISATTQFSPYLQGTDTLAITNFGRTPNPANDLIRSLSGSPFFTPNRNHWVFFVNQSPQANSAPTILISRVN